ncbi:MAG TPA: aminoacyl--tRNA ligase-related protein [Polyangiaceae bacterium]|nr:aminoacyl--tRNA ligase-related protein [Polyangiaceae bacterium]
MNSIVDVTALNALGLGWQESGQSVLSGKLLELEARVDQSFVALARAWNALEYRFPTFISAVELQKLDYFRSFPHLVSFPVSLDPEEANLEHFAREPLGPGGEVQLTKTRPVREVLTPAACYHIYIHEQSRSFDRPRYYTTRNTCFRREQYYEPLRRQWGFNMREIVCVGTLDEVKSFLTACSAQVDTLLSAVGLEVAWTAATDPFFQPSKNAKYIAQRVNPTKTEAIFGGDLAIASVNLHQDHFGHTFGLSRQGAPSFSGCVAFGIERWLHAVVAQHGLDANRWPSFPASFPKGARTASAPVALAGDA